MENFDGLSEALFALRYTLKHLGLLVWAGLAWSIILIAYPWLMLHALAYGGGAYPDILRNHWSGTKGGVGF